jgi:hypothetical protein
MAADRQSIPVQAYAVAAYEAARLFGEDAADVFDPDATSRARIVAILALRRAFPRTHQVTIANNMGMEGGASSVARKISRATSASSWNDATIDYVEKLLSAALRRPITIIKTHKPIVAPPAEQKSLSGFKPRAVRPARLIAMRPKTVNVTAALMGDPGALSMRVARGERSAS